MKLYIIGIICLLIIIYVVIVFNKLLRLSNKVKEAFSTMDVYLKKRWDLIPNLVEIVKGYTKHENETLNEIIDSRNNDRGQTKSEKIATDNKIESDIGKIMAVVESYPELKADTNFKELSKELTNVEDEIANARKYYNAIVRMYNNKIEMFPSNLVAKVFGFKTEKMFEAKDNERNNINIKL